MMARLLQCLCFVILLGSLAFGALEPSTAMKTWLYMGMALSLLGVPACLGASTSNFDPSTPLNRIPFLMTHDTATGYLGEDRLYEWPQSTNEQIFAWTKTQIGNVTAQLNCGARAFDMRPHLTANGDLIMHHGAVVIDYPFRAIMEEVLDWAKEHPDELIIPQVFSCGGDTAELNKQCDVDAAEILADLGIPYIYQDKCPDAVYGMTLGKALELAKIEGGGSVLTIWSECFEDNYDPSRNCRGYEYESAGVSRKYNCWLNGTNPDHAIENIFEYLDELIAAGPPQNGTLAQNQALWQVVEATVTLGFDVGASILVDELYSRLNRFVFENITTGRWGKQGVNGFNFLEVDHVCDSGQNIFMALDPEFNGTHLDYPDDVLINDTSVVGKILSGENVFFPDTPENYTARTFSDNLDIRKRHRQTRWGNPNDIVLLFNGSEEQQQQYLKGILGTSIWLWCLFAVWAIVLAVCKWTGKLGWLAGIPPDAAKTALAKSDTDTSEHAISDVEPDFQKKKIRRRVRNIRIAALFFGFCILLFSGLLIGLGFCGIADTLDHAEVALPQIRAIFESMNEVTHLFIRQMNQTEEARINYINAVVWNCNLTSGEIENLTGFNLTEAEEVEDFNGTDLLIQLNETLDNLTQIGDVIKMNESLYNVAQDIASVEDTVDNVRSSVLLPIAITFVILFDVVVVVFMTGVILAWRKQQPRLFYDCTTRVAVPVFLLLLLAAYVTSTLGLVGATMAADFCIETPDNQVVRIIDAAAPFDEFLEYYVRGCNPSIKPELLFDFFKALEYVILEIDRILGDLSTVDPNSLPCNNAELVLDTLDALQVEYNQYMEMLYLLGRELVCDRINPIYTLLAYNVSCIYGFDSMSQIFGFMLGIAVCSMGIVTIRVAWYQVDDAQDEKEHQRKEAEKETNNEASVFNCTPDGDTMHDEQGVNGFDASTDAVDTAVGIVDGKAVSLTRVHTGEHQHEFQSKTKKAHAKNNVTSSLS